LSYFAKPNFIVYDEWFENDLKKKKMIIKKIKNISKIHEFFYEQSNYKVGASENNLQIDINENREELFNNYYVENNYENMMQYQIKNFSFLKKLPKKDFDFLKKVINFFFYRFIF